MLALIFPTKYQHFFAFFIVIALSLLCTNFLVWGNPIYPLKTFSGRLRPDSMPWSPFYPLAVKEFLVSHLAPQSTLTGFMYRMKWSQVSEFCTKESSLKSILHWINALSFFRLLGIFIENSWLSMCWFVSANLACSNGLCVSYLILIKIIVALINLAVRYLLNLGIGMLVPFALAVFFPFLMHVLPYKF